MAGALLLGASGLHTPEGEGGRDRGTSLATSLGPQMVAGQGVEGLADECAAGDSGLLGTCRDAALASRELQGGFGLAVSGGSLLGASGSTLGHRVEGEPRISLDVGGNLARTRYPDVLGREGAPDTRRHTPTFGAGLTVGVFDGFRVLPTVGGVLSVDLVGRARLVSLSEEGGFSGSLAAYGAGVRVGLLRESFTLPGVTLSAAHHRMGSVRFGSILEGDPARVDLDPRSTSLRLVVEKDVLVAGFAGGVGWERVHGPVTVRAAEGEEGDGGQGEAAVDRLRSSRPVAFAGANLTFLVLRLSAEVGWAPRHSAVDGWADHPFRSDSAWFGTLGIRVTY